MNLDDKKSKGIHWASLFINRNTAVYFESSGIEYIPQEVLNKIRDKSISRNIFRMQSDDSVMCGFYCIAFIEYTNLFYPNDYKKNEKIIYKYFKDKYVSLKFKLKKIDETRNYLLEEINLYDLMREKYKKTCKYLNYVEHLLILALTSTSCVSVSTFASLVCVPVGITSSAVGIKICAITAGIKKYKSIIKKKKKKHDKIVLLGKSN